jgi:hypothetical protein
MKAKWTILTYIAAHNNLDAFGKTSLHEILGVGSNETFTTPNAPRHLPPMRERVSDPEKFYNRVPLLSECHRQPGKGAPSL